MPQKCSICSHSKRLEMEREYASGQPVLKIARNYGVDQNSLYNHCNHHLSRQLVQAFEKKSALEATEIIGGVEELLGRTRKILDTVEKKKRYGTALNAIKEMRGSYELLSKIAYALHQARTAELELEQSKQSAEHQEELNQVQESLQVLDEDELIVYEKLCRKIRTGNKKIKALPKEYRNTTLKMEMDEESGNWQIEEDEPEAVSTFKRTKHPISKPNSEPEPSPQEIEDLTSPESDHSEQEQEKEEPEERKLLGYTESGYAIYPDPPEDSPYWDKARRELVDGVRRYNKR